MTPIPNEKLTAILRAAADCREVIPRGEFQLDRDADGEINVTVVDDERRFLDHVATTSTHEMDRFLVTVTPATADAMAQEILHTRGLVAQLLIALRGQRIHAGLDHQIALHAFMTEARVFTDPQEHRAAPAPGR